MESNPEETGIFRPDYWDQRYANGTAGWDMGTASPPLMEYCRALPDRNIRILIPGGGSSADAGVLWHEGFRQVFVLDWSEESLKGFQSKFPDFPSSNLLHENFFAHGQKYDLVLEQTFYCALPPEMRDDYVYKMANILQPGGIIAGVLFDFPLSETGPPYGGCEAEYLQRFSPYFEILHLEPCRNSIPPRAGRELFVQFKRKSNP